MLAADKSLQGRVLQSLRDAVIAADRGGTITEWTGAAAALLGREHASAVGTSIGALFADRLDLDGLLAAERVEFSARLQRADGTPLPVMVSAARTEQGTVMIIKDAAPAPEWSTSDLALAHWDRTLGSITRDLLSATGRELGIAEMAAIFARHGVRMLPDAEVLFCLVPADRQDRFQILAGCGPWAETQVGGDWPKSGTVAGSALTTLRTIETTRIQERSILRPVLRGGGIQSGRLVPLVAPSPLPDGRRALGVIGFFRQERRAFSPVERRLIHEYARLVTLALHQSELRQAAQADSARLRTGITVAADLAGSLEPEPVVRRLLEHAARACDAERTALLRVEGDETIVEDCFDVDGRPEAPGYRHPISSQPLMQAAIAGGQAVTGGPFEAGILDPPLRDVLAEIKHTVTLPLQFGGRVIAVMVVSRRRDLEFTPGEVATLRLIGNVAVLALRNSRLFAEAQEASRSKGEFLNMAAHELRTPLTIIIGYLSMLREGTFGEVPQGWHQPLESLSFKAAELGALIEDLLLASRLETGGLPLAPARVDLRGLVDAALRRAEPRARLVGAALERRLPEEPVLVEADPDHIARVLDNLINNALTYTSDQPRVEVEVRARPQPAVSVLDNGRGIAPENRDRIFERFVRLEEEPQPAGTGLGLYISGELVSRAGGSLTLEWSELGRGSRFTFRLPGPAC